MRNAYIKAVSFISILAILSFFSAHLWAQDSPDVILGKWWYPGKLTQIEIYRNGKEYRGKIVWLKELNYPEGDRGKMEGKPKVDRENPDPLKRNRPLLGMDVMWNIKYFRNNTWEEGYIYDPRDGKTYECKLVLESPDVLKVRGDLDDFFLFLKTLTLRR